MKAARSDATEGRRPRRILHIFDAPAGGFDTPALALLADELGLLHDFAPEVLLLGSRGPARSARNLGIEPHHRLSPPLGLTMLAFGGLRRLLREAGGFDLIHTWSPAALTLAALSAPHLPRVLTLTRPPSPRAVRWLRMLLDGRRQSAGGMDAARSVILTCSATIRRGLLCGGVPEQTVHVLRPSIHLGRVEHDARAGLRRQWDAGEHDRIVALLSNPPEAADAREAILTVGLADESQGAEGLRLRLLVHPRQRGLRRALRSVHALRARHRLIVDPRIERPWQVLPGCDLALAPGEAAGAGDPSAAGGQSAEGRGGAGGGGGLSLLWAMAANVPIVGEATYAISEIIEDRHSALLARPGRRDLLVRQLLRLCGDARLAWQLRDTARHEAYSFFSRQHHRHSLSTVYEQLLTGAAIAVPPLPATGGLRFAGRA